MNIANDTLCKRNVSVPFSIPEVIGSERLGHTIRYRFLRDLSAVGNENNCFALPINPFIKVLGARNH